MYSEDGDGFIVLSDNAPERMKRIAKEQNEGMCEMDSHIKALKESGTNDTDDIEFF